MSRNIAKGGGNAINQINLEVGKMKIYDQNSLNNSSYVATKVALRRQTIDSIDTSKDALDRALENQDRQIDSRLSLTAALTPLPADFDRPLKI